MNENTPLPDRLARLAAGRANLQRGCETARACGDSEWAYQNRDALDEYDREITALLALATPAEIREAREITNAPI